MWYLSIRYVERGRGGQGRQDKGERGREGVGEIQEGYEKKRILQLKLVFWLSRSPGPNCEF